MAHIHQLDLSKTALPHYLRAYETYLGAIRHQPVRMLELGVAEGASLRHWEAWMPQAQITGLDIKPCPISFPSGRVQTYLGEQQDLALLDRIGRERAPDGFDLIIDDASHIGQLTRISFWHLFDHHLKPGGLFVIEDWGTGYWPAYPDGRRYRAPAPGFAWHERLLSAAYRAPLVQKLWLTRKAVGWSRWHLVKARHRSHDAGMVGAVKQLIDEMGSADATHSDFGTGEGRASRFEWLHVLPGQVFIRKAA